VVWAWPLVGCSARVGPVWLMAAMPYVTSDDHAKSRQLARAGWKQAVVATGWLAVVATVLIAGGRLSAARLGVFVAALLLVTVLSGWRYHVRVGGLTGDFLGATEQLGEIAALAVLAWYR
jgi:adenosylcobinamide-GDP ribazoletransferase